MQISDLIQQARRLTRQKQPAGVSLVHLAASPYIMANAARYHFFRNSIAELATAHAADLHDLGRSRLCLVAADAAGIAHLALRRLLELETEAWNDGRSVDDILEGFRLPDQYMELRERLDVLERAGRHGADDGDAAARPVLEDRLAGPLTPALLARIEDRLDGIDLAPFVRRQAVYRHGEEWEVAYTEHFTSLDGLKVALFPEVELRPDEPLFFELCRHLDRLMLLALLLNRPWRQQRIGLNLGHAAWATEEFRRLLDRLDAAERGRLTIELHWMDALRDQAAGGAAMAEMRAAGIRIAIDRIGIESLPLLNLDRLEADHLKLVFDKGRLPLLLEPAHLGALRRCRTDRVVLTQCDDPLALSLGQQLGITHYQGWLIDRLAREAVPAEERRVA
jgi:hypothetical protein